MFNPLVDIDRRIEDLQRLKSNYSNVNQPPINIYNNNTPQIDFKAQMVNENEIVEDLPIQSKTCFIDLKKGYIAIKEINGDIAKYDLVLPKDAKDLKIEELERKLREYEQYDNANYKVEESECNDRKSSKK